jgi:cytochrome c553
MARQILAQWDSAARRGVGAVSVLCILAAMVTATDGHGADVELGRYLSSECATCHSPTQTHSAIPNIYGMIESTFAEVVKAYRDKRLNNPVMQNVAARLNDEDIAALAAYFATTKKPK